MSDWPLNDSAPAPLAGMGFEPAAIEGSWSPINDSAPVVFATAFAAAATDWATHDWLAPLGYPMAAEAGGAPSVVPLRMLMGVGL